MISFLICIFVGVLIVVLGAINMTGNISSLHSYHRHRVSEENRLPFGRMVGLGTILCGLSVIVFGIMMFVYEKTKIEAFSLVGTVLLLVGLAIGLVITFRAMIKYNGGIF